MIIHPVTLSAVLTGFRLKNWIFTRFFAINEKVRARFLGLEE
jgi:hypothetical protein